MVGAELACSSSTGKRFLVKGGSVLYPKHPLLRTASSEALFFKSQFPIQLALGTTFFGVPIQLGMRSLNSCFMMKLFFFLRHTISRKIRPELAPRFKIYKSLSCSQ